MHRVQYNLTKYKNYSVLQLSIIEKNINVYTLVGHIYFCIPVQ